MKTLLIISIICFTLAIASIGAHFAIKAENKENELIMKFDTLHIGFVTYTSLPIDPAPPFFIHGLKCPTCQTDVYLHQAINDIEHPAYNVDCIHDQCPRLLDKWYDTKQQAIDAYKKSRQELYDKSSGQ